MALGEKNSNFDALNVMLNVLVTPLSYRRFFSISKVGTNFVLVVPTSRVPGSSVRKNASPTPPLVLTIKPTAPTPSTSFVLVSLKEPQDLTLHLCLPSSRSPPRQCLRFHHSLLMVWIFAVLLLYKNPKWTRNSGILLTFLTIPPMHVGPCMLSPRRVHSQNCLQLQEHPCTGLPWNWNYYKFTKPKVEKFFCPDNIKRCVKKSRRKWVDKFSADQERPPILPM